MIWKVWNDKSSFLFHISLATDISWCSWVICASLPAPVKYLVLVVFYCNKMLKKNNLKEAMFTWAHCFRGVCGHLALWVWAGGEAELEGGEGRGERRLDRAQLWWPTSSGDQVSNTSLWGRLSKHSICPRCLFSIGFPLETFWKRVTGLWNRVRVCSVST